MWEMEVEGKRQYRGSGSIGEKKVEGKRQYRGNGSREEAAVQGIGSTGEMQ